jgi:hypothetical protein
MKSTRKLKAGQLVLPTLPTAEQKAAMDAALSPGVDNPFLTRNDSDGGNGSYSADTTDYNYHITGKRIYESTPSMYLRQSYVAESVKVYLNGMRLTRGTSYDYREVTANIIVINFPLEETDLLVVDYKATDYPIYVYTP